MAGIAVSAHVVLRNRLGQFRRECSDAARETITEAVNRGADMSRSLAPAGHKADPRTIPLKSSIYAEVLSRTQGRWVATARHALPVEFSAGPHAIPGEVSFFWENAGRMWIPYSADGPTWLHPFIMHPGNPAQPYLRPAYHAIMGQIMAIAAEKYPG